MTSRRLFVLIAILIGFWLAPRLALSDISLPKYFSDHMVLQQNGSMRIWGKAEPKERLTIKFDQQSVAAVADGKGNWAVNIETGPAGGPYQLEIASGTNDTKVIFSNVMVGEVWICGGEDNMSVTVAQTDSAEANIADAKNFSQIRLFKVEQHASNDELSDFSKVDPWYCCSSDTIKNFSAIGYLYARELSRKLDVPIGLIQLTGGPIALESWVPRTSLQSGGFDQLLEHWSDQNEPSNPAAVSSLFNGMVAPLAKTPIGGVIWDHGSANIGRGDQYSRLFPLFIDSWRKHFNTDDLPFYFVQPAPFRFEDLGNDALPEIWDAQLKTFNNKANLGIVVTTDLAEQQLTHNKHKLTIARRLAGWAFKNGYRFAQSQSQTQPPDSSNSSLTKTSTGNQIEVAAKNGPAKENKAAPADRSNGKASFCSGPIFESAKVEGNSIVIRFRFAKTGLKIDAKRANEFSICGADKKFTPAWVRIDGSKLLLSHPDIEKPVAARYGWQDTAQPVLTNSSGLPAAPFRTDDFQLTSAGIEF